jgi:GNAT superfamily N-acetyltransferase
MRGPVSMTGIVVGPADVEAVVGTGLLAELDADLLARYPGEPVNGIEPVKFRQAGGYFVLARVGDELAGCGAFRPYDPATVELKRMFVRAPFRGRGIARAVVDALEAEARRRGYAEAILETAARMPEAIALYRRCGYGIIPAYGPFVGSARSVCMRHAL